MMKYYDENDLKNCFSSQFRFFQREKAVLMRSEEMPKDYMIINF